MTHLTNSQVDISVDCVVFGFDGEQLKLLLIDQKLPDSGNLNPDLLQIALPGDLMNAGESLDACAARVLKELTSLEGIYLKQFYAFGDPNRVSDLKDQEWLRSFRVNPERRVITVAYYSLVKMDDYVPQASSFASNAKWIDIQDVPELAFDHNDIVDKAIAVLRQELTTKHIGFELLPEKFTLSQLQTLYETILDKKLDKRNFRKNIKKMDQVIPLDEKQQGVLHKPAQLFRFDRDANDNVKEE
ncbi:NUDIX hydrolase [Sanyastnella coralliicola]|uniref:NUDIX hydrolase n=1 Tax=Sanyastnella coralliicola TaxID=3069118 RepID=UPI0027B8F5DA|nr:NUDIX domain-containing protein [Longitalea sp. SCSIO 12813]